jgi:hypothetical protein
MGRWTRMNHWQSPLTNRFGSRSATKQTLVATDAWLKLVNEVEPKAMLKYNRHYIGLEVDGAAMNCVTFTPRKAHVIITIKLPQTKETDDQLEEAGVETLTYESRFREYRIRLESQVDRGKAA